MVSHAAPTVRQVPATTRAVVQRVLPRFGLVDVVDDDLTVWSLTRGTPGPGFDVLSPGVEVELDLRLLPDCALVTGYRLLGDQPPGHRAA